MTDQSETPAEDEIDDLEQLCREVDADPVARAAYEAGCRRQGVEPEPKRES